MDFGEDGEPGTGDTNGIALSTVEIFGCPQQPTSSVSMGYAMI